MKTNRTIPTEHETLKGLDHNFLSSRYSYDPDTGHITNKFGRVLISKDLNGYSKVIAIDEAGKRFQMYGHRLSWFLHHGHIDPKLNIDHVDGDTSNNKLENLRLVTQAENLKNKRMDHRNTTGFPCVFDNGSKGYSVRIKKGDYGSYDTFEQAKTVAIEVYRVLGFHENHGRA